MPLHLVLPDQVPVEPVVLPAGQEGVRTEEQPPIKSVFYVLDISLANSTDA